LKFVTTGAYPPFSDRGKNFITDPKLAGTPEVKGDIRLRFRTVNNKEVIAKKMIAVSKTVKGLSLRAVEQSLKTRDAKLGEVEVSQRCSDI
jgi:DNA repair protein RAD50